MAVQASLREITFQGDELAFEVDGRHYGFERMRLPADFMEWVIAGRRAMYARLAGDGTAPFFSSHLPVVVTYNRGEVIPFNTGNKGVGLLPVEDALERYCDLLRDTFEQTRGVPASESLPERLAAAWAPFADGAMSDRALITLEIFEKRTFRNLCDYPVATLHYTDQGPVYKSFQIDAVVEILTPERPAYRFAYLSRQLFEMDTFHITQTRFPFAYLFHPVRVQEKTPVRRH